MKNETSPDKLWLQKEVIEYLRCHLLHFILVNVMTGF